MAMFLSLSLTRQSLLMLNDMTVQHNYIVPIGLSGTVYDINDANFQNNSFIDNESITSNFFTIFGNSAQKLVENIIVYVNVNDNALLSKASQISVYFSSSNRKFIKFQLSFKILGDTLKDAIFSGFAIKSFNNSFFESQLNIYAQKFRTVNFLCPLLVGNFNISNSKFKMISEEANYAFISLGDSQANINYVGSSVSFSVVTTTSQNQALCSQILNFNASQMFLHYLSYNESSSLQISNQEVKITKSNFTLTGEAQNIVGFTNTRTTIISSFINFTVSAISGYQLSGGILRIENSVISGKVSQHQYATKQNVQNFFILQQYTQDQLCVKNVTVDFEFDTEHLRQDNVFYQFGGILNGCDEFNKFKGQIYGHVDLQEIIKFQPQIIDFEKTPADQKPVQRDAEGNCFIIGKNANNTKIKLGYANVDNKALQLGCVTLSVFSPRKIFYNVDIIVINMTSQINNLPLYALSGKAGIGLDISNSIINATLFGRSEVALYFSTFSHDIQPAKKSDCIMQNSLVFLNISSTGSTSSGALTDSTNNLKMINISGTLYSYYLYNEEYSHITTGLIRHIASKVEIKNIMENFLRIVHVDPAGGRVLWDIAPQSENYTNIDNIELRRETNESFVNNNFRIPISDQIQRIDLQNFTGLEAININESSFHDIEIYQLDLRFNEAFYKSMSLFSIPNSVNFFKFYNVKIRGIVNILENAAFSFTIFPSSITSQSIHMEKLNFDVITDIKQSTSIIFGNIGLNGMIRIANCYIAGNYTLSQKVTKFALLCDQAENMSLMNSTFAGVVTRQDDDSFTFSTVAIQVQKYFLCENVTIWTGLNMTSVAITPSMSQLVNQLLIVKGSNLIIKNVSASSHGNVVFKGCFQNQVDTCQVNFGASIEIIIDLWGNTNDYNWNNTNIILDSLPMPRDSSVFQEQFEFYYGVRISGFLEVRNVKFGAFLVRATRQTKFIACVVNIKANSASQFFGFGGIVYESNVQIDVTNCSVAFSANSLNQYGGAVALASRGNVNIENATFQIVAKMNAKQPDGMMFCAAVVGDVRIGDGVVQISEILVNESIISSFLTSAMIIGFSSSQLTNIQLSKIEILKSHLDQDTELQDVECPNNRLGNGFVVGYINAKNLTIFDVLIKQCTISIAYLYAGAIVGRLDSCTYHRLERISITEISGLEQAYYSCVFGAVVPRNFVENIVEIYCPRQDFRNLSLRTLPISYRYNVMGIGYYTFERFQFCLSFSASHSVLDVTLPDGQYFNNGGYGHAFSSIFDDKVIHFIDIEVVGQVTIQVVNQILVFGSFQSYQNPKYCQNGVIIANCVISMEIDYFSLGTVCAQTPQNLTWASNYRSASCVNANSGLNAAGKSGWKRADNFWFAGVICLVNFTTLIQNITYNSTLDQGNLNFMVGDQNVPQRYQNQGLLTFRGVNRTHSKVPNSFTLCAGIVMETSAANLTINKIVLNGTLITAGVQNDKFGVALGIGYINMGTVYVWNVFDNNTIFSYVTRSSGVDNFSTVLLGDLYWADPDYASGAVVQTMARPFINQIYNGYLRIQSSSITSSGTFNFTRNSISMFQCVMEFRSKCMEYTPSQ